MDSQKTEHDSEWTTVSTKKTKHRTGKRDSGTLKAAQKPVVLFISRVDPDTTQEEVEKFANIHFQKTEIHCEKLKTRYNFYASFKVTLQGVEMEDALSSHIWPSGILVKIILLWKDSQPQKRLEQSTPNNSQQWQQKFKNCQQLLTTVVASQHHYMTLSNFVHVSHNVSPRNLAG